MDNTILIVEDDQQLREALKIKLEKEGYKIMIAKNGAEGLNTCNQKHVDLILLDIVMPEMDGLEMLFQLKQGGLRTLPPVIILTNLQNVSYPGDVSEVILKSNISLDRLVKKVNSYFIV